MGIIYPIPATVQLIRKPDGVIAPKHDRAYKASRARLVIAALSSLTVIASASRGVKVLHPFVAAAWCMMPVATMRFGKLTMRHLIIILNAYWVSRHFSQSLVLITLARYLLVRHIAWNIGLDRNSYPSHQLLLRTLDSKRAQRHNPHGTTK